MGTIVVSVVCTNCGNTVCATLKENSGGGKSTPCFNCGGLVTFTYSFTSGRVSIRNVKTMGGHRR